MISFDTVKHDFKKMIPLKLNFLNFCSFLATLLYVLHYGPTDGSKTGKEEVLSFKIHNNEVFAFHNQFFT